MRRELDNEAAVREHLACFASLREVVVTGVDLAPLAGPLASTPVDGAVLLGCPMDDAMEASLAARGAVVFPDLPGLPYRAYRSSLYTVEELLAGLRPEEPGSLLLDTTDGEIYRHFAETRNQVGPMPVLEALAQRLHDHAMDTELRALLHNNGRPHRVVGVMGGHAMQRSGADYHTVAQVAWRLCRAGYFVATGGGPGAMEAANLGAWMSPWPAPDLEQALAILAPAGDWHDAAWFHTAMAVRQRWPSGAASLGVPTWYYGHEPTNLFAAHVAKYFNNSLREDGLVAIAMHGILFAPGSAGTIQEVFQDATQNHYGTLQKVSPMVFLGSEFWLERMPLYPLLQRLAAGRQYGEMLACLDNPDEIVDFIERHPPVDFSAG